LRDHGATVRIIEAADRPGGRLATVSVAGAVADVGALVEAWPVYEWCRGFGARPDGCPRYAITGGMARLADVLAEGLDITYRTTVQERPPGPTVITPPRPDMEYERCIALVAVLDRPPTGLRRS
jgi:predicted NAD/FAD-dependent oxidoreductase